ncbi:glycoside hydrolase family 3 N-terminal domain-containing protein [Antrihabitans cavernicola]|uniref:beta-N-acetylhexosaminidase n=1 Tax=Antrihabitans cavernicola TaxID=2495913 RepID=A0A5A7S605_9NOCA|nr:glycoside hydrolase family 3 N-terminal domain-containing protein [Spelaeibacter cavernicola]KAA0017386.1 glycoside hydrolase family 3 protein [Spelaeibacter cavernicola]
MRKTRGMVLLMCAAVVGACSTDNAQSSQPVSPASSVGSETATPASASAASPAQPLQTKPAADCGSQFLASLNERQKLAQLLTVGVTGTADATQVVANDQVGGIFIGGWTDQGLLGQQLAQVKGASKVPLMVTIDEEGGRVSRVADLIGPEPSARQMAATVSVDEAYQRSLARGKALKGLGITVNFAPDADVSDEPDDAVIGDRSFSNDPAVVTKYADAYIRGMHDAGIQAVIKHFPGHGHGSGDSHKGSVTTPPLTQLMADDLVPFRNLVNSGAGVMVGHLDVPGLTTPNVPASISPQAMTLLRTGIGYGAAPFNGPIFTDDLSGMAAITERLGVPQAVEAAIEAGADVALWITTDAVPQVLDQLQQAVASGRLSQQRVDDAVLHSARFKGAVTC